MKLKSKRVNS